MVTRRTAKIKGSSFEYSVQHSLGLKFGHQNVSRTAERGYQLQYDIKIDFNVIEGNYIAIECKREAGFTWNKLQKYFEKLESRTSDAINHYLIFKANRQPCLVMNRCEGKLEVSTFEDYFGVDFEKHPSTRK